MRNELKVDEMKPTRETWHGHTVSTDDRVNDTVGKDIGGSEGRKEDD
jgi:hypothetical protein